MAQELQLPKPVHAPRGLGHLGLELAHPQAIQSQGQGLAEANQIHLATGLAMGMQAAVAQAQITMAFLELRPSTQVGPQNPRIAQGGGGAQGRGRAQGSGHPERGGTDQHHRQAPLGKRQGQKAPGKPPPNDGDVTRAVSMHHLKPAG